jgi:hypothetical protein
MADSVPAPFSAPRRSTDSGMRRFGGANTYDEMMMGGTHQTKLKSISRHQNWICGGPGWPLITTSHDGMSAGVVGAFTSQGGTYQSSPEMGRPQRITTATRTAHSAATAAIEIAGMRIPLSGVGMRTPTIVAITSKSPAIVVSRTRRRRCRCVLQTCTTRTTINTLASTPNANRSRYNHP